MCRIEWMCYKVVLKCFKLYVELLKDNLLCFKVMSIFCYFLCFLLIKDLYKVVWIFNFIFKFSVYIV